MTKKGNLKTVLVASALMLVTGAAHASPNFTMSNASNKIVNINRLIDTTDTSISLSDLGEIDGLSVSAKVTRKTDRGYARVLLVDLSGNEYLVFETNSLLDSNNVLSVKDTCEETCELNGINAASLRIEMNDASVTLNNISVAGATAQKRVMATSERNRKKAAQHAEKLKKVKENIAAKGYKWSAGETSVSKLSYAQKKQLLGGALTNLYGFEYYTGGIFEIPSDDGSGTTGGYATYSPYVDEFSWKYAHGEDWLTSVKNQGGCGSCWDFAATGATELLVNLYYNDHLDMDLAEQDVLSCSNAGSCAGGLPRIALDYITTTGVVEEACFPYSAADEACSNKCTNPSETVQIGGRTSYSSLNKTDDDLKALIIEGPVSGGIYSWRHAMVLFGYKVLHAGDYVYLRSEKSIRWVTIPEGDPLVGRTAWHFKNSWGSSWGDGGYVYVVTDHRDIGFTHSLAGWVSSANLTVDDIVCVDNDDDGYYNWGLGGKPAHCPANANALPDGDDSNPCFGPVNEYGYMQDICQHNETVNLGTEHHWTFFTAKGTTNLEITDWTNWGNWSPSNVYVAVRPEDGYVMDGLSLTIDGVTTPLSGWWQEVPTPYTGQSTLNIQLNSPAKRNVSMDWWAR